MQNVWDPFGEGRFIQRFGIAVSALLVSIYVCRQHALKLSEVTQVMNRTIEVFGPARNANIVSNVNTSSVVHSKNQSAMKFYTHVPTNIANKFKKKNKNATQSDLYIAKYMIDLITSIKITNPFVVFMQ